MKHLLPILVGLSLAQNVSASSIIFLDEGLNTAQHWSVAHSLRGSQGCSSIQSQYQLVNGSVNVIAGSLCNTFSDFIALGSEIAEYSNNKTYKVSNTTTSPSTTIKIRERRNLGGGVYKEYGEHGNWVSNAARDFDVRTPATETLVHRPWAVFGLDRRSGRNMWVTADPFVQSDEPGATVLRALDLIARGTGDPTFPNSELRNLGAVNMSFGAPNGGSRCTNRDGQEDVWEIMSYGIAVIVGLPNQDIPDTQQSWPNCLDGVINVAGNDAPQRTGVGVGKNGIDFFAKYQTNDSQVGNSFAAPRVAAAFAQLHKLFPNSTVSEKYQALQQADTKTDSYRTGSGLTYTARMLEPVHMTAAIEYMQNIYQPPNPIDNILNIVDNDQYGPFYGDTRPSYAVEFDFSRASKIDQNVLKAGSGILGAARDVKLSFKGVVNTTNSSYGFKLLVNNAEVAEITGFNRTSSINKSFIINRNQLITNGRNTVELVPIAPSVDWGVTQIKLEFLPVVPLTVGVRNNSVYGYDQNPTRYTGMRASFELEAIPSEQMSVYVEGWDMDVADENEVFINGKLLGHLAITGASSTWGPRQRFVLPPANLIVGTNYIEFVQRAPSETWSGYQDEKWAVRNILVHERQPFNPATTVPPILLLLMDEEMEPQHAP